MSIDLKIQEFFISPVYTFDLDLHALHSRLVDVIAKARERHPEPEKLRSNVGGWKSDYSLFDSPEFEPLAQHARQCFEYVFRSTESNVEAFKLVGSVNITEPGGYNVQHNHAGCFLSGCYYLKVPPNSGEIVFHDPRPGSANAMMRTPGSYGSLARAVQPLEGQLVLFPSWLEHSVRPNESDEARISIPMNALHV